MVDRVGSLACVSIDCDEPAELADFYCALLGLKRVIEADGGDVVVAVGPAVAAAEALGARQAGHQPSPDVWRVMLDPAGHPFCLTTDVPD